MECLNLYLSAEVESDRVILTPLPFVLAADVLQTLANDVMSQGNINRYIPPLCSTAFPIGQHGDDTLVFMQANELDGIWCTTIKIKEGLVFMT
jgi:hypothetical protein